MQAIWEPEFRGCSYGFRPERNAHQALRRLGEIITNEGTEWLVEADIKGFFDNVSHDWLMRFVAHRLHDPVVKRIIRRLLKAGVLEEGVFTASETGTPQGGLVSPVLANIYLHYVLDLWFEKGYTRTCKGRAYMVRYADDFVTCFTHEEDARRFMEALTERLAQFGLEVEPSKTGLLCFGRGAVHGSKEGDHPRCSTFDFLGFTHYAGRSRSGRFVLVRKSQRERIAKKLKGVNERLSALRVERQHERLFRALVTFEDIGRKTAVTGLWHLQGHRADAGIYRPLPVAIAVALPLLRPFVSHSPERSVACASNTWFKIDSSNFASPSCPPPTILAIIPCSR